MDSPRRLNWNSVWQEFANATLEDGDFDDAVLNLSGLESEALLPASDHVRSLMAMALDPLSCANDKKAFSAKADLESDDPFVLSAKMMQNKALSLLRAWLSSSPEGVLRALPGHADVTSNELDGSGDAIASVLASPSPRKAPTKSKGRQSAAAKKANDDPDDMGDDAAIHGAGRRIGSADNIWAVLKGKTLRKAIQPEDEEQPTIDSAWELLDVMVDGWESDAAHQFPEPPRWSPSLLMQFVKPATGPRKDVQSALSVVLFPFLSATEEHAYAHDLDIDRMRETAARLLGLLFDLAIAGRLDADRFVRDLSLRLSELPSRSIKVFVTCMPPDRSTLRAKLCMYYIDNYSQPIATPNQNGSSQTSSRSISSASPRKLAREGSISSQSTLSSATFSALKPSHDTLPPSSIILNNYLPRLPLEFARSGATDAKRREAVFKLEAIKVGLSALMLSDPIESASWLQLMQEGQVHKALEVARSHLDETGDVEMA